MAPTEYVLVEDPHDHGVRATGVPAEPPHRPPWRRVLVGLAAAAAGLAIAIAVLENDDPAPSPEPVPTARAVNAERQTALAYAEWRDRKELVDCMAERGYPYEARIVDNDDALATVADLLAVEPATADPDAPIPMLRHPDLYLGRGGQELQVATGSVGCQLTRTGIDVSDPAAVAEAVAAARVDRGFRTLVAEQVWVDEHPAEVSQRIALLTLDREPPLARDTSLQEQWGLALEAVVAALPEDAVWVPVTVATADAFAQGSGITETGHAIVLRVGQRDAPLSVSVAMSRADLIHCGPVSISAAIKTPYGAETELDGMMRDLATACGALADAGFVEPQTLAEVYFD